MLKHFCILLLLIASFFANAQAQIRPINSAWMVEFGAASVADTYLSPVKYSGLHYAIAYNQRQALSTRPLLQGWDININFNQTTNPVRNASMLGLRAEGGWRLMNKWNLPKNLTLGIGGYVGIDIGVLYLSRNGNNPAQAEAAITVGPQGFIQWKSKLGKTPITLRVEAWSPLFGGFFCPDYGELYYEISLGNLSDLAHIAWSGNYRRFQSLLSLDFHLGKCALRLGYKFIGTSVQTNHITMHRIEHSAVLGIVFDSLILNPKKPYNSAKIIPAYN